MKQQMYPYNVRVQLEAHRRIQEQIQASGLTASEIISQALCERWEIETAPDPTVPLLLGLAEWITANYSQAFPENVVLLAAQHIRKDPELRALYEAAIRDENGEPAPKLRKLVAQKIGRTVRRTLSAEAFARSLAVPNELISTYSLLRPSSQEPEEGEVTAVKPVTTEGDEDENAENLTFSYE